MDDSENGSPLGGSDVEPLASDAEAAAVSPGTGRSDWSVSPLTWGTLYGRANFDDVGGDVRTARLGLGGVASRRLSDTESVSVGIRVERSFYDFVGFDTALNDDPFQGLVRTGVWGGYSRQETEDFSWTGSLFANAGWQDGADVAEGLTYGVGATVRYRFSDTFAVSAGLVGTTRLEDSFFVFPVSVIDWKFSDRLHVGEEGSGVGLGYELDDSLRTYGNLAFAVRQFRLDDPQLDGGFQRGVFRDDELTLNLGAVWEPDARARLELFGGIALRSLTFLRENGTGFTADLDPGPYVGLSLRIRP